MNKINKSRKSSKVLTRKNLSKFNVNIYIEKTRVEKPVKYITDNGRDCLLYGFLSGRSGWCPDQIWASLIARDCKTGKFFNLPVYGWGNCSYSHPDTVQDCLDMIEYVKDNIRRHSPQK